MNEQTSTKTVGGFTGDPAEAYTPPAAGGCCGSPATTATGAAPQASACCGTPAAANAASSCCDPAAKADAVTAGTGCCG